MINKWDEFYLQMAHDTAQMSRDTSTKVGAVIVGPDNEVRSIGYNDFCRGIRDGDDRRGRPQKYLFTEHAERNALYNALRAHIPVNGCRLYLNYAPAPCADCARGIICSGIREIIMPNIPFPGVGIWKDSLDASISMCHESGVRLTTVDFTPKV